jgi:predicted alpha/beta-fold hydrolase
MTERGGHIEYLSGWRVQWWAFNVALEYFKYFEIDRRKREVSNL